MKRWFFLAGFGLLGVLFFKPLPASAGLHICNKTNYKVYVAVAIMSGDCFMDWCHEDVQGWWNIEPGNCKTPLGYELDTSDDTDYYYYAEDTQGATWTGGLTLCVDPTNAFEFKDREEEDCVSNTKRKFKNIPTAHYTDYTLNLTP